MRHQFRPGQQCWKLGVRTKTATLCKAGRTPDPSGRTPDPSGLTPDPRREEVSEGTSCCRRQPLLVHLKPRAPGLRTDSVPFPGDAQGRRERLPLRLHLDSFSASAVLLNTRLRMFSRSYPGVGWGGAPLRKVAGGRSVVEGSQLQRLGLRRGCPGQPSPLFLLKAASPNAIGSQAFCLLILKKHTRT